MPVDSDLTIELVQCGAEWHRGEHAHPARVRILERETRVKCVLSKWGSVEKNREVRLTVSGL